MSNPRGRLPNVNNKKRSRNNIGLGLELAQTTCMSGLRSG